jgi:hypothetical protein
MRGSTHGEKRPPDFQELETVECFEPKPAAFVIHRTKKEGPETPVCGRSK